MTIAAKIGFLDGAIASQRGTQRLQRLLSAALMVLGVVVVILALAGINLAPEIKSGQTLGGLLLSASSSIPILSSRRDKIAALRFLRTQYASLADHPGEPGELQKLDQHFDQLLDKHLGG